MTEPWGWQLEGPHLIINYFILGDQVVMTPAFWGSEPVTADSGKYAAREDPHGRSAHPSGGHALRLVGETAADSVFYYRSTVR